MYEFENLEIPKNQSKYFFHGVNEGTTIDSVEFRNSEKGGNIKVILKNPAGNDKQHFIFPFKAQDWRTDKDGNRKDDAKQVSDYLNNIAHLFTRGTGLSSDEFKVAMKGITSFEEMGARLKELVDTKEKKPFALMLINDKKSGFPKLPDWTGGFASYDAEELKKKWNEAKYGKPSAPANSELPAPAANLNDMFAQFNETNSTPTSFGLANASGNNEPDSDELPF